MSQVSKSKSVSRLTVATSLGALAFGAALVIQPTDSNAVQISGPGQISFSSASGVDTIVSGSFAATVDGILDAPGNNSPFNGVSLESFPLSVTYNFDVPYDLTSFFLLAEVGTNSFSNAVQGFELQFFDETDGGGTQVGNVFGGQQTNATALQEFAFAGVEFLNVQSIEFSVLSVNGTGDSRFVPGRVEFSELQFAGSASVIPDPEPQPVSEPGALALFGIGLGSLALARRRKKSA